MHLHSKDRRTFSLIISIANTRLKAGFNRVTCTRWRSGFGIKAITPTDLHAPMLAVS